MHALDLARALARAALAAAILVALVASLMPAQPARGAEPVVRAVMFYAPTCPHCHELIERFLPPLTERYGDGLELLLVNKDVASGYPSFRAAMEFHEVPADWRGVPALLVGDELMLGDDQIRERLVELVDAGLAQGGVDWPPIPELEATLARHGVTAGEAVTVADMTVRQRLGLDPTGSAVALAVLAAMVASVLLVGRAMLREGWPPAPDRPSGAVPVLAAAGLAVAAYLAYVETTETLALCGPVGDCNTVQQSAYARLLGVPIGVLGVAGYVVVLALWAGGRGTGDLARRARTWLPAVALAGVLFSIYLTFLEPFVIGAVCMWCVASAVLMTGLLWASTERPARPATGATGPSLAERWRDRAAGPPAPRPSARALLTAVPVYLLAAVVGVVAATQIIGFVNQTLLPPTVGTLADASRRQAVENAVLVLGLVLGPVLWHVIRTRRR